jgi:large subunit ribosomal protein L29
VVVKTLKAFEIKSWSDEEIKKQLDDAYQELFNLRFQSAVGQVKDTSLPKKVRKNIARMKTVLSERK